MLRQLWRRRRFALQVECLERREMLAGNLQLTGAFLINGLGQQITAPVIGEMVGLQANWIVDQVPAGSPEYYIKFLVDGVELNSNSGAFGAGQGTTNHYWQRFGWYAAPGPHTVTITVDGANAVAEMPESDNSASFSFTPVLPSDLPSKLQWPMGGERFKDYSIVNYCDVDPRGGTLDFLGGPFQYNGHDAYDISLPNFTRMDQGIPVFAAAAGVVGDLHDGEFDRVGNPAGAPGNFVRIDHGNGWSTLYYHFAAHSIAVELGDTVSAGELLALVGSSGNTTDAHLHFTVLHNGLPVEPNYALANYFLAGHQIPYQGDVPSTVMDAGITNYEPFADIKERPSQKSQFTSGSNENVWFWYRVSHVNEGESYDVKWYRPDGTLFTTYSNVANDTVRYGGYGWVLGGGNYTGVLGNWRAAIEVEGVEIGSQTFTVISGAAPPEMLVRDGSELIVDNRSTPIDFGTVSVGSSNPQQTFTIVNHGGSTLTRSSAVQLPAGFSLVGSAPASIPAGGSATVTIAMSTATVGTKFGKLRLSYNDPDESAFDFTLKGVVTGTPTTGTPTLTGGGAAAVFVKGSAKVLVDPKLAISDAGAATWSGSVLKATLQGGEATGDVLAVYATGSGASAVALSGSQVRYGGVTVGQFTTALNSLTITFNASATQAAVQAVARSVGFKAIDTSRAWRDMTFSFTDAGGLSSGELPRRIVIDQRSSNRAPVLNVALNPTLGSILEDTKAPAGTLVSSLLTNAVTDADTGATKGIAVVAAPTSNGVWQFRLNASSTWQSLGSVSESQARLLPSDSGTKVRFIPKRDFNGTVQLSYRAWDRTQGAVGGTFNVTGKTGGTNAFSTAKETAPLTITAVNDKPVVSVGGPIGYVRNQSAVLVSKFASVTDGDSANFATGQLRVQITTGASSTNRLSIGAGFTIDANNNVKQGTTTIGKLTSNGFGTKDLVVTFNASATKSIVQQLLRAITFKTVNGSAGTRKLLFTLNDGDGGTSNPAEKTVNVA